MMKKTLGQVLVDTQVLSKIDLEQYQNEAKKENLVLTRYLQDKNIVSIKYNK